VDGGPLITQWHKLRFAQRHLNMCSMALTRRVLTLTGRMSLFRATVVTDPEFIHDVGADSLQHWRLGRFRFLTGDDKSSWYSLMRQGWDTWYVPDAAIDTLESPPSESFIAATRQLMFRWYGNSLRQNSRAVGLGPRRLGPFCFYVLLDQRVSMWTSLLGLSAAIIALFKYGFAAFGAYLLWIGLSRLWMTLLLTFSSGHRVHPSWPMLLYYNQIVGSTIKIHAFYHMDQQSWTRQKTVLARDLGAWQQRFNRWSSRAMTFTAASIFAALILRLV
jgi:glycosyltransferase Alg8